MYRIKQVRDNQQKALTEKAKLRSLDQRISAVEQMEKKAKLLGLKVWLYEKGTIPTFFLLFTNQQAMF
jgi:hypothetical protein